MNQSKTRRNRVFIITLIIGMLAFIFGTIANNKKVDSIPNLLSKKDQPISFNDDVLEYKFQKEGEMLFYSNAYHKMIKIDIEVADNFKERMIGLMYRKEMLDTQAMLFIFEQEEQQSFWMKNTYLSLDIFYLNNNGEIVDIFINTEPLSPIGLPSSRPVQYVVETVAGFASIHQLKIGDKLDWILN